MLLAALSTSFLNPSRRSFVSRGMRRSLHPKEIGIMLMGGNGYNAVERRVNGFRFNRGGKDAVPEKKTGHNNPK